MIIKVNDASRCQPIKEVKVLVETSKGKESFKTDKKGKFNLPERIFMATLSKKGYITKSFHGEVPEIVRLLEDEQIGYLDKLWFKPKETIKAYINSSKDFSLRIYRHGIKKQLIKDLGKHKAITQIVPDGHFVENGLDWKKPIEFRLDSKPGLYSILIDESYAIPFILSSNKKSSKIMVLTSTTTWLSYNLWGGRSRYKNLEHSNQSGFLRFSGTPLYHVERFASRILPDSIKQKAKKILGEDEESCDWYFKKLSIKRPFTNCSLNDDDPKNKFTNHLAAGEWRILAWLEREGYDYDIISGFELHSNPKILDEYKALILSTHSEYWSKDMFNTVKRQNEKGMWIVNLGANSIFREIKFFRNGSQHCKSLSFNETVADESKLLGVRFTPDDYSTCAPYKVIENKHWAFEGVKKDIFGEKCLNTNTKPPKRYDPGRPGTKDGLKGTGASGWETDKLTQSGEECTLLAKGMNKNGGADMVINEDVKSFSVSSITFGGSLLIDDDCSKIVNNVLTRILTKKNQ